MEFINYVLVCFPITRYVIFTESKTLSPWDEVSIEMLFPWNGNMGLVIR